MSAYIKPCKCTKKNIHIYKSLRRAPHYAWNFCLYKTTHKYKYQYGDPPRRPLKYLQDVRKPPTTRNPPVCATLLLLLAPCLYFICIYKCEYVHIHIYVHIYPSGVWDSTSFAGALYILMYEYEYITIQMFKNQHILPVCGTLLLIPAPCAYLYMYIYK